MGWSTYTDRINKSHEVEILVAKLREVHAIAIRLHDAKATYVAGTDTMFVSMYNNVIDTSGDRTEFAGMVDALYALVVTDWEANHAGALGI